MNLRHEYEYLSSPEVPALIENPLTGASTRARLVIDTGAQGTILDRSIAEFLELDLENVELVNVRGVGGNAGGNPQAEVDIVVLFEEALRVRLSAVFVPDIADDLGNLLGLDYFAQVNLGLSHAKRTLYFGQPA